MDVDAIALEKATNAIFADFGMLDDMPQELRNTLANIYYKFFALNRNLRDPGEVLGYDNTDFTSIYKGLIQGSTTVLTEYKFAKGMIDSLREARKRDSGIYDYLVIHTLDILKYRIPNAHEKTPIRRAIERKFRKHREVNGLYDRMEPILKQIGATNGNSSAGIQWRTLHLRQSGQRDPINDISPPPIHELPSGNRNFAFSPTMPDITKRKPVRNFRLGNFLVFLVKDAPMIAEGIGFKGLSFQYRYPYTMVAADANRAPRYFVTLEVMVEGGSANQPFLGAFSQNGEHRNYGTAPDLRDEAKFVERALTLIGEELGVTTPAQEIQHYR